MTREKTNQDIMRQIRDAAVQAVAGRHYFTPAQMLSDYLDTLIAFGRIVEQDGRFAIKEN